MRVHVIAMFLALCLVAVCWGESRDVPETLWKKDKWEEQTEKLKTKLTELIAELNACYGESQQVDIPDVLKEQSEQSYDLWSQERRALRATIKQLKAEIRKTKRSITECQEDTDWLERSCNVDSDCPVDNAVCFKGQCLCNPGYYYSTGNKTCGDCQPADLGKTFLKYKGSQSTYAVYVWSSWDATEAECRQKCFRPSHNCRSYDHNAASRRCYLYAHYSAVNGGYIRDAPQWDYYRRTCA